MKKRGFTLAEILGVIVLIGLLLLLVTPVIVGRLSSTKNKALTATNRMIYNATSQHIIEHRQDYPAGKRYCITVRQLIDEGKLASPVKDVVTGKTVDDNYSVLVSIYSTGNEYYEGPFVDKECEETSSIPMIDFLVEPSGTSWVKSRKVTIKYPNETSERKYQIDGGSFQNASSQNQVLTFTKPGQIVANAKFSGSKTESKINVVNIDSINPTITINGQPTCKKSVTFTLKDTGGSKLKAYAVIRGTSAPAASDWKETNKVNEQKIKFTAVDEENYTIYVKDNAGNEAKYTFKPNVRHQVTFNTNGGTPQPATRELINNKPYDQNGHLPNRDEISKKGYIFRGWYEDNNTFSKRILDSTVMCVNTENNVKNLYVKWEAKKVRVTFYRNTSASDTKTEQETFTYDVANQKFGEKNWDLDKVGYTLQGWNEDRNAKTAKYGELSGVSNDWIHSTYDSYNTDKSDTNPKDHSIYLIWKSNEYKLSYDLNKGNGSTTPAHGSSHPTTATYDTAFTVNNPSRTGYSFAGWSITGMGKAGVTHYYGSSNTSNSSVTTTATSFKNLQSEAGSTVTMTATWTPLKYTLFYDANGGSVGIASNQQTFDSNYANLPTPTRQGYQFLGWFTAASGGTQVSTSTRYTTASNSTVYAHWKFIYTKPSCSLSITGTKGNNDWYRSDVAVSMTTSSGSGIPQSYGLSTSRNSTNGSKTVTHTTDGSSITYYGYVSNEAGSNECSISFKRDATRPLTTANNIYSLSNYTIIHSSTCNNVHSGTCYVSYSASYSMLYNLDYTCDDYGGSGCSRADVKWLHDGSNQKLCPDWTDFDTCLNNTGFKTGTIPSYTFECFRTYDNAGNLSDEICIDMRRA